MIKEYNLFENRQRQIKDLILKLHRMLQYLNCIIVVHYNIDLIKLVIKLTFVFICLHGFQTQNLCPIISLNSFFILKNILIAKTYYIKLILRPLLK